jgi:hypothetical protein
MALQLATFSRQLDNKPSLSTFQETLAHHDADGDDARPMASFMPEVNVEDSLGDLMSVRLWRNHVMWRAGASVLKSDRISAAYRVSSRS